MSSPLW